MSCISLLMSGPLVTTVSLGVPREINVYRYKVYHVKIEHRFLVIISSRLGCVKNTHSVDVKLYTHYNRECRPIKHDVKKRTIFRVDLKTR